MSASLNRRILAITLVIMVIYSPLSIDIFLPALPLMAQSLMVDLTTMQSTVGVYMLSLGVGQLVSGPLADRYGRKPVALVGIAIYILSAIATAFAQDITMHLLARFTQGLGACAIIVTAFACVRDCYDPLKSGAIYSYLNGAICCIPALAPILGDVLTVAFDWRANFYFIALYGTVAGIFIVFSMVETKPAHTQAPKQILSPSSYWQVLKQPIFLFNTAVILIGMAIIIAYVSSSPAWLMVVLNLSQSEFVFWFSINAAVNIAACLLAPKVLLTYGPRFTTGVGMLVLIFGGVLMYALLDWHDPLGFMLPILASSLGFSLLMGTCSGQALAPFGEKAGTASALLGFIQMSGSAVIVFLVQMLPINQAEQVGLLMLCIIPLYILWLLPSVKHNITVQD